MQSEPSINLLARARAGDGEAMEHLCGRHRVALKRWAHGRLPQRVRDGVDTDDLVQDVLFQTVRNIPGFEPRHDGALRAYLRQALQNRIRDEIRKHQRRPEMGELRSDAPGDGASPLEHAVGAEKLERYEAALALLRAEDRELIVLRIEMGLGYEELAREVGKPSADAARMAVLRAVARLAEALSDER